jgi:hypothetical protein
MLSGNAFSAISANTYRDAMQSASVQRTPVPAYANDYDHVKAVTLAALAIIADELGAPVAPIGAIDPADIAAAQKNFAEAMEAANLRLPEIDPETYQGIVLYYLNQILVQG